MFAQHKLSTLWCHSPFTDFSHAITRSITRLPSVVVGVLVEALLRTLWSNLAHFTHWLIWALLTCVNVSSNKPPNNLQILLYYTWYFNSVLFFLEKVIKCSSLHPHFFCTTYTERLIWVLQSIFWWRLRDLLSIDLHITSMMWTGYATACREALGNSKYLNKNKSDADNPNCVNGVSFYYVPVGRISIGNNATSDWKGPKKLDCL